MISALKDEKIPYYLTLVFAITGWLVTHIVNRLTNTPLIEYSIDISSRGRSYNAKYLVRNITNDKNVENIEFLIAPEASKDFQILSASAMIPPPLKKSSGDYQETSLNSYKYILSNFQPNSEIIFEIETNKREFMPLRVSAKTPVLLKECSIATFFVKHEILVLVVLSLLLVGLLVLIGLIK